MKRFLIYICILIFAGSLYGQGFPNTMFPVLNLDPSARLGGLGTRFATSYEPDINLAISNQSLLPRGLNNFATLNFTDYFSAYTHVNAAYSHEFQTIGAFLASFQHLNYGYVESYDERANFFGPSDPRYEMIMNVGWGKALDSSFSIGANFKYIFSRMDLSSMQGIAVDLNASYVNAEKNLAVSLGVRNIGTVLGNSFGEDYEKLPFEVSLAAYKRLAHAPFAFSLVLANLQKWNLSGVDLEEETIDPITQETTTPKKFQAFADNLMRHIVPGIELVAFKRFTARLSFNYQRRKELMVATRPGALGFSWGVGAKIYKFQIDYARATYHLAGAPNFISISANLSDFIEN